ncbi:MAG: hypothetical protein OEX19_08095, partial [Gammaproteobacteria bacterium]|nr:hypothetical protein [Gammaproteobacteria bacterium]
GRIKSLDGEQAGTEVCKSEKREYEDNIWPIANAVTDTSHSNTSEFTPDTDKVVAAIDEPAAIVRKLFNNEVFSKYASQDYGNFLLSPASSVYAYYMMRFGADDDSFRDELIAQGIESDRDTLIAALKSTAPQSISNENIFWVQTDYEIRTDYLNLLASGFMSEMQIADFYKAHTEQQTTVSDWATQYIDRSIPMSKFIGERTRFVYGSAFSTSIPNIGQSTIGTFAQEYQLVQNIPMTAISGAHPYFENETLKAIEIQQTDVNTDLLIIMPGEGQFNTVEADLATTLSQIDNGLSIQEVTFKLPHFSLNQDDTIEFNSLKPYTNASDIRPMLALSQLTKGSLKLNGPGLQAQSYSLSTLLVPTDHGGFGRGVDYFDYVYFGTSFANCNSNNPTPVIDARPFIVVLRDRSSGIVLQIGRVVDLNYEPVECSVITTPVEPPIYTLPLPLPVAP